jgi:hypothetical protein
VTAETGSCCTTPEPKNSRSFVTGTCSQCGEEILRPTGYIDPECPWVHLTSLYTTPEQVERAARHSAASALLEAAAANYAPIRDRWNALGPFTLPERSAVRSHRIGQAVELVVSLLARGRWPEHNPRPIGFLALWLHDLWDKPSVRQAARNGDTPRLVRAVLRYGPVSERDPARSGWHLAPGYADDIVALADAFFPTIEAAGLGGLPCVVSVEDILVGDCLIDLKVSSSTRFHREWLAPIVRRLIYPPGRHGFYTRAERVGLYSARHPALLVWDAEEFLGIVSGSRSRIELEGAYESFAGVATPEEWARESGFVPTRSYYLLADG